MSRQVRRDIPSVRGPGRAIVVTVLVVAALLVAADVGLRFWAQAWIEDRVGAALGISEPVDLALGGFPFLPAFLRGHFDEVTVEVDGLEREGIRLERVTLDLRDVRFDRADLIARRAGEVTVAGGSGQVEILEADLNAWLGQQGSAVSVDLLGPRVRASAIVSAGGQEATASATGRLRLEGGALAFDPGSVQVEGGFGVPPAALAFTIALPPVLPGVSYRSLEITAEALRLELSLEGATLDV